MPASSPDALPPGVYELLVTEALEQQASRADCNVELRYERVSKDDVVSVLGRYLADRFTDALRQLKPEDRVEFTNAMLSHMVNAVEGVPDGWSVTDGPRQLLTITEQVAPGVHRVYARPQTPFSRTGLLTNAASDVSLLSELKAELASADQIELLCAFVRWTGIRLLDRELLECRDRGVPLRVITTTYMGATERRAVDELVTRYGAEVQICYETQSTRLHAKAWLFTRASGFSTAYVGSSNLSKSALLDGLEWNVRLSAQETPDLMDKFRAVFNGYWNDSMFEAYDPTEDAHVARLDAALKAAGSTKPHSGNRMDLAGLQIHALPHQSEILERLAIERTHHDEHKNLVVAATGSGKTVMAALDYARLCSAADRPLRLLFVAHRKEILMQSLATYRNVLVDQNFGELFVDGERPKEWKHVFASIQSLTSQGFTKAPLDQFEVVVVDEFHHAEAATYQSVIKQMRPQEFLGLTATPERADGKNVQDTFFEGRIAAELRLWDALEADLLCPFHYFGVADGTDLRALEWRRGTYSATDLEKLYTSNDERTRLILEEVDEKVADVGHMRALGFCVSVAHAEYMTQIFNAHNIPARTIVGTTSSDERAAALAEFRAGNIRAIFTVDLFNEGLDIPEIDTVLLLRPTTSATIFLQQLGRGLRRAPGKSVLTVLDFIGQQHRDFRFEERFHALTGFTRRRLSEEISGGFPHMPAGCHIILDKTSQEQILEQVRTQVAVGGKTLAKEIRGYGDLTLAAYLTESGRDVVEIYTTAFDSWTSLRRMAGLPTLSGSDRESQLLKRMPTMLHVDDPERAEFYTVLLRDDAPDYDELSEREKTLARMLFFTLWRDGGGFSSYREGFRALQAEPAAREEMRAVIEVSRRHIKHLPIELGDSLSSCPLTVHSSYSTEEILAGLGVSDLTGNLPSTFQSGVQWADKLMADALFITREKDVSRYSENTLYHDYAMSTKKFHWETQNRTSTSTPTGRRYVSHKAEGSHVLLFTRRTKVPEWRAGRGVPPYLFLGPATYVSHSGERPMAIEWELEHEMPGDTYLELRATGV